MLQKEALKLQKEALNSQTPTLKEVIEE